MEMLDKKNQKQIRIVSKKLGLPERVFLNRAVSAYIENIKNFASLKKELFMWDVLTAETMKKYKF